MTPVLPSHPPASHVAREFHRRALLSGMSAVTFAQRLADAYHASTPLPDRVIELHAGTTADAQLRAMKQNATTVSRLVSGAIRFPLDLLDAWAQALPDGLDLEFRREMARRLGFLGALPPSGAGSTSDVGALAAEFGQTMTALAPLLADGRIDASDCPALVRQALREGTDLMAAWMTLQAQLLAALPEQLPGKGT